MTAENDDSTHEASSLHSLIGAAVVGVGWRLLQEGEPLQGGDGFLHPDYPGFWTDYKCRPDIFRGGGTTGTWYHVPPRDFAHTWPWRRRVGSTDPSSAMGGDAEMIVAAADKEARK